MRGSLSVSVACSLVGLFGGSNSAAGSLTYAVGAGYVEHSRNATGLFSFGVSKFAIAHFEVAADVAYLHYTNTVRGTCIGGPCPPSDLETSFIPVSVGLIGYLRGPKETGPYGEFSPSLCVSRWSAEGRGGSEKFTNVAAGLKAGLGMRFAINESGQLDLGLLYLLSGSGDIEDAAIRDLMEAERFDGLKNLVPFARLSVSL